MIRVVHISPTDIDGGAALGAYRLHKSLQAVGVDSRMLVLRKYSDDPSVTTRTGAPHAMVERLRDRMDHLPLKLYRWTRQNWWTVAWLPFDVTRAIERLDPDIVHFHWAGRGVVPIDVIRRLERYPLVWTLRDMWPLTGGCHYTGDCTGYLTGCGACPQIGSTSPYDISRWQWMRKKRAWRDARITFVGLSNWIADCARQSPLVNGNDVDVIPNGIDLSVYKPADKAAARAAWELPRDRRIILYGALGSLRDPRKGFRLFVDAVKKLASEGWPDRALIVVFGLDTPGVDLGLPTHYIGKITDETKLAALYSAADVMAAPSVQENLAKTALESMACGTPVVAFANTGNLDIVDHKVNGYLADNLSAADLARGIVWCLEAGAADKALGQRTRDKIVRCFDARDTARRYAVIYQRLTGSHRAAAE